MQNQAAARATEQCAAKKHLSARRGGLPIGAEAAGTLEFSQQIEQQQDAAKGRLGGEELLQAKIIGRQIVFQYGDAIFHVCPAVVITPDFSPGQREVGDEQTEGVARNLQQFSSQRGMLGAQLLADDHEASRAVPTEQLQAKLPHRTVWVQGRHAVTRAASRFSQGVSRATTM